ncbi:MAG: SET domain-containing protein [Candidatus Yonathbacteria bacterium]|nr:SET domain-containing protein [Candidatus Yonathbacteria bacterium]
MIHITYKLKESPLHGIGLFTDEDLIAGQLVYTASPLLDVNITQEQFDSLTDREKEEFQWWGFFDEPSQRWHVDFDVSKFINHALEGTVTQDEGHDEAYLVTTRDMKKGEELTQNYLEFETEEDLKRRGIVE